MDLLYDLWSESCIIMPAKVKFKSLVPAGQEGLLNPKYFIPDGLWRLVLPLRTSSMQGCCFPPHLHLALLFGLGRICNHIWVIEIDSCYHMLNQLKTAIEGPAKLEDICWHRNEGFDLTKYFYVQLSTRTTRGIAFGWQQHQHTLIDLIQYITSPAPCHNIVFRDLGQ